LRCNGVDAPYEASAGDWIATALVSLRADVVEELIDKFLDGTFEVGCHINSLMSASPICRPVVQPYEGVTIENLLFYSDLRFGRVVEN
jgi:hypothetical protein